MKYRIISLSLHDAKESPRLTAELNGLIERICRAIQRATSVKSEVINIRMSIGQGRIQSSSPYLIESLARKLGVIASTFSANGVLEVDVYKTSEPPTRDPKRVASKHVYPYKIRTSLQKVSRAYTSEVVDCGYVVYRISHEHSQGCYIGSTKNFNKRKKQHIYALKTGRHWSRDLQRQWNRSVDPDSEIHFDILVDDIRSREDALTLESHHVRKLPTHLRWSGDPMNFYNRHSI